MPSQDLVPVLFPVFFIGLWLLVGRMLSLMGGWTKLAGQFAQASSGDTPLYARGGLSGTMGWVSYNHVLSVALYPQGLRLGILFLFRIGHPALFLPREALTQGEYHKGWFGLDWFSFKVQGVSVCLRGAGVAREMQQWWSQA